MTNATTTKTQQAVRNRVNSMTVQTRALLLVVMTALPATRAEPLPSPQSPTTVSILFGGDTSPGENYLEAPKQENILATKGYDYPFEKLKPLLRRADLIIANLETPLPRTKSTPATGKVYVHWSDPVKTPDCLLRHGIQVVSLANNHACDYGVEGLQETLDVLDKAGIRWFGAGQNQSAAGKAFVRPIPVGSGVFTLAVLGGFEYLTMYDETFGFYAGKDRGGVNLLSGSRVAGQIRAVREQSPEAFVVVFPHWGSDYCTRSEAQVQAGHRMIDNGADLVLGHGAHTMQEIEFYRGRWIIYGIGNLVFNSPGRYEKMEALPYSLVALLVIGEKPEEKSRELRLYPIFTNNRITKYQTRPVTEQEFDVVVQWLKDRGQPESRRPGMGRDRDDWGWFVRLPIP